MNERGDQVAAWLKRIGKDRNWLADRLGAASRHTVDKYFGARGRFPDDKWKLVTRMMVETVDIRGVHLTFEEFGQLQLAAKNAGMEVDDLVREYVRAGIARWKTSRRSGLALVAERGAQAEG